MTEPEQRIEITLMADWEMWPLWVAVDGGVSDSCDTGEVGEFVTLSPGLLRAIDDWNQEFQRHYDPIAGQDSGFADPEELAQFNSRGRELADRLRSELPAAIPVNYEPFAENGGTGEGANDAPQL